MNIMIKRFSWLMMGWLLLSFGPASAQQPAWTDYYKRTSQYPSDEYLCGFFSGKNTLEEDPVQLLEKYREIARARLIQSIQVSIESNSSLNMSNVNGKSDEEFLSRSISFSKADITGLNTDVYYDKKKDEAYAFAWVNKKELAFYKRKLIADNLKKLQQKLDEGRSFKKLNEREKALKSFYEGMPLVSEAEEAQWLLMAIGRDQLTSQNLEQLRQLKIELDKELSSLQQAKDLNMAEAAYFVAYGLYVQLNSDKDDVSVGPFTFENSGLLSPFSTRWDNELKDALIKTGHFNVTGGGKATGNILEATGNFWKEDDMIRVRARIFKNGEMQAVAEGVIPVEWLKGQQIEWLPAEFEKISQLPYIKQYSPVSEFEFKAGQVSETPMVVLLSLEKEGSSVPLSGADVSFVLNGKNILLGDGLTDENGRASIYFPALKMKSGMLEVKAGLDLAKFTGLDTNTVYYAMVRDKYPVLPVRFNVKLLPSVYYIESQERAPGLHYDIKTIEPQIKNDLSDMGYQFSDQPAGADYIMKIDAAVTTHTNYGGIYFAYVDANLSLVDGKSGLEVYKTSIEQVKGSGANDPKAAKKAFQLAAGQLRDKVLSYLEE